MKKIIKQLIVVGGVVTLCVATILTSTVLINQRGISDGYVINIAGRERMLSQKISKEIFMINSQSRFDFHELDSSISDFEDNLNTLRNGNQNLKISPPQYKKIVEQLDVVNELWLDFCKDIERFKLAISKIDENRRFLKTHSTQMHNVFSNQEILINSLNAIAFKNPILLKEIDKLVEIYAAKSSGRRTYLETFQYSSAAILVLLALFSLMVLKGIKGQFDEFLKKSKEIATMSLDTPDSKTKASEIIEISGDSELSEISKNLSSFFSRINEAKDSSNRAKELSERIAHEIALITEEVMTNIDKLELSEEEKSKISAEIDFSEDIAIQSSEELIATSKLLERLRQSLDNIAKHYPKPLQ